MSIDDEHTLRERLDSTFGATPVGVAPADVAVQRGRRIRRRRHVTVAAGLAAVAAACIIAVPVLQQAAADRPPAAGRYTATVQAPGRNAQPGEFASGTINGQRWRITAGPPGAEGAAHNQQAVSAYGPAFGSSREPNSGPAVTVFIPAFTVPVSGRGPVSFGSLYSGPSQAQYGAVAADVSFITVRLDNGTVLTLYPVTVYGVRMVAFAAPVNAGIVDATAYSQHGEIATAVPFNAPGSAAVFTTWLRPGQHGLTRVSGRIGSGAYLGRSWSASAYQGPWGICIVATGGGTRGASCVPGTSADLGTSVLFWTSGDPEVAAGNAAPSVARLVVHRPDGTTIQVQPVTVGQQKFFAFPMRAGRQALSWQAYDSSGTVVASSAG